MLCAKCGLAITAEAHKDGRFTYYHCTWFNGKCGNDDYYPEKEIEQRLRVVLERVHADDAFADLVVTLLSSDATGVAMRHEKDTAGLRVQLKKLKKRSERAYLDKLDGKITEEFWLRQTRAWDEETARTESALAHLEIATPASFMPIARRTIELAKRLPELVFSMEIENRRILLNSILLNLKLDTESLYADYQTPWNLLANKPSKESWGDRGDLNPRPPRSQRGALTS